MRPRRLREELPHLDKALEEKIDSEDDRDDRDCTFQEEGDEDSDVDMQDASLQERLLQSAAREPPKSKLKGKDGFVRVKNFPSRRLGV